MYYILLPHHYLIKTQKIPVFQNLKYNDKYKPAKTDQQMIHNCLLRGRGNRSAGLLQFNPE